MNITLTRDNSLPDCTLGILEVQGTTFQTMEKPWITDPAGGAGGEPNLSCVPPGVYQLVRHDTPKHPKTWALVNHDLDIYANPTPGKRADCLIHEANWAFQLEGCIAPGLSRIQEASGRWMVTSSRDAFQQIQKLVPWTDEHILTIQEST